MVRARVRHGLTNNSRTEFLRPKYLATARIHPTEPTIRGTVERNVASRYEHTAHGHIGFLDGPYLFAGSRVPGHEFSEVAAGRRIAMHIHPIVWRTRNVTGVVVGDIHADIKDIGIYQTRSRRSCGWLPILTAYIRRTDIDELDVRMRFLVWNDHRSSGLHVETAGPVLIGKRTGLEHFPGGSVDRVGVGIAVEVDQHLARLAIDRQVHQDILVDGVVIPSIVGRRLVSPACHAAIDVASEDRTRPQIVAGPLIWDARRRIASAVINEIQ